jgi:hypothetical protein
VRVFAELLAGDLLAERQVLVVGWLFVFFVLRNHLRTTKPRQRCLGPTERISQDERHPTY